MLWFSSNGGITRYAITENRFYNYNHLDGVPMGDFMGGSVTSGKDGTIFSDRKMEFAISIHRQINLKWFYLQLLLPNSFF